MSSELKNKLQQELDRADWTALKPHLQRDAIIVVDNELDLISVGEKVAEDNVDQIRSWLNEKKLTKPSSQQVQAWENTPESKFLFLIVQPYVLIQPISH